MSSRDGTCNWAPPSAPGSSASVTLFDSTQPMGSTPSLGGPKLMRHKQMSMLVVDFTLLDQTITLTPYMSRDGGTTWRALSYPNSSGVAQAPVTVTAVSANSDKPYKFDVSPYEDFKLVATAGVTPPTPTTGWDLTIGAYFGSLAIQE